MKRLYLANRLKIAIAVFVSLSLLSVLVSWLGDGYQHWHWLIPLAAMTMADNAAYIMRNEKAAELQALNTNQTMSNLLLSQNDLTQITDEMQKVSEIATDNMRKAQKSQGADDLHLGQLCTRHLLRLPGKGGSYDLQAEGLQNLPRRYRT
jgi:hypothetical protein